MDWEIFPKKISLPWANTNKCFLGLRPFLGLTGWAGTRKVKPTWILQKQATVSGISWAACKSAPRSRQMTMPAPHHSVFLQVGCPSCRPTNSVKALKAHLSPIANDTSVCSAVLIQLTVVSNRRTQTHRPRYISNNRPHLCSICMWCGLEVVTSRSHQPALLAWMKIS